MKKFTLTVAIAIILALFVTNTIKAQDENSVRGFELGIRYMPTFSSLDLQTYNGNVVKGSVTMQHGFGVMLGFNLSKNFGILGEIDYNQVSQKYKDVYLDRKITVRYINIPILLSLNTNKASRVNLNFVAGPQFGINVGSDVKTTSDDNVFIIRPVAAVKKGDVGVAYGAGLELLLNRNRTTRLDLGYRGVYGLVDMDSDSDNGTYNVIIKSSRKTNAVYVGFTFLF